MTKASRVSDQRLNRLAQVDSTNRRTEGLHVVIPSPRYQSRITSLAMNGTKLRIDCDDGVTVERMLSLPQPILAFFTEVVDELREAAGR